MAMRLFDTTGCAGCCFQRDQGEKEEKQEQEEQKEQEEQEEVELGPKTRVVATRLSGDVLVELDAFASWRIRDLSAEVASLVPLEKPHSTRYAFIIEGKKLLSKTPLGPLLEGQDQLDLIVIIESLPWGFSSLRSARSSTVRLLKDQQEEPEKESLERSPDDSAEEEETAEEDEEDIDTFCSARRRHGRGGVVFSNQPVPWHKNEAEEGDEGSWAFEVIIDEMTDTGYEGVELGVTDSRTSIEDHSYAVLHSSSWVSSDAGTLWIHRNGDSPATNHYPFEHWRSTSPRWLKVGDVVSFRVFRTGGIEVRVNGEIQAEWPDAKVKIEDSRPLYAIVGMRAPCAGVTIRLPEKC